VLVFFVIGSFYKYGQAQALKNSGVVTSFAGLHLTKLELIEGNGDLAPRHVLAGLTARVEDSGTLNRRITATRLLAVGVFALAIKKKQDDREVYLTIEGPTTAILRAVAFKVNPKAGEDARRFAAQLNLFSRTTALRPTAVPVPADGVPDAEPPVAAGPFDVTLINAGDKKIQVIKVVREAIPGIGLKEAKDLVEAAPIMLTQLPTENEALRVQASLERAGASVLVNAATV
jgi:large subunit ribosomal protein L7/L12